jgi:hypothetical protein
MKLAMLVLVAALGGTAAADPYAAPYGGPPPGAQVGVGVVRVPARAAFRQMLLERFDRNHDGVLEPRERRHAARALRRLAKRMARDERGERRGGRERGW